MLIPLSKGSILDERIPTTFRPPPSAEEPSSSDPDSRRAGVGVPFLEGLGMAGSWIKMRAALRDKPEVIRIAKHLAKNRDFRSWVSPFCEEEGADPFNVCYAALRIVACGVLLMVWSNARENGVFVGDDLFLVGLEPDDLDEMGCPGIGAAMVAVGWATVEVGGLNLPRFKTYNVPMNNAERQAAYRERRNGVSRESNVDRVTTALPEQKQRQTKEQETDSSEQASRNGHAAGIPLAAAKPPSMEVSQIMRTVWPKNHEKAGLMACHENATLERVCWVAERIRREKPGRPAGFMERAILDGWEVPADWAARFSAATGNNGRHK